MSRRYLAASVPATTELPRLTAFLCQRLVATSGSADAAPPTHGAVLKLGLHDHAFLNNTLLARYAKSRGAREARYLFDEMPQRDVVTWTSIISAHAKAGDRAEALLLLRDMLASGCRPNEFTFSTVLRCRPEFATGTSAHAHVIKLGLDSGLLLGSVLMNYYSQLGMIEEVSKVFETISDHGGDTVSWTTLISAFVQAGDFHNAVKLYFQMVAKGIEPNEYTFVNLSMACGCLANPHCVRLVHAHSILWGAELNLVLKTAIVDMYSKCGGMEDALKVLRWTSESDVTVWTSMITGYNQIFSAEEAMWAFREMLADGISPNAFAYAGILSTCSSVQAGDLGRQIHTQVVKIALDHDSSVGNSLMDMYSKSFSNSDKQTSLVFEGIKCPNLVSWTILVSSLAANRQYKKAASAFAEMRMLGFEPSSGTICSILKNCGLVDAFELVTNLHTCALKMDFLLHDAAVRNSLIDAYVRLGNADKALKIFDSMHYRDVIAFTSLAKAANEMGLHSGALGLINRMHREDVKMDSFSLSCFLSASAGLAAMEPGKQLHCHSVKSGLAHSLSVSNGLIDMYSKCGSVKEACSVFTTIQEPNVVSWNGLISGLASNGRFADALSSFEDMRIAGTQPDDITILIVLYACSHAGLADLGLDHFNSMSDLYGIAPKMDHYICLVDLFGRAGRLDEALNVINTAPFQPDALMYKTLLGSCRHHQNLSLGEYTARRALELDPSDPAIYVLLSNIYEDAGQSDQAKQILTRMKDQGMVKCPGESWLELRSKLYLFRATDMSNPNLRDIHEKLESLERAMGSKIVQYSHAGRGNFLHHSEKLALAFGLLHAPSRAPIRIIKNLRTCEDCHTFMEIASQIVDREIIMRDGNRFHFFTNGACSCGGYW